MPPRHLAAPNLYCAVRVCLLLRGAGLTIVVFTVKEANSMAVLLVNGSPHEAGSTYTALSEVEGALHKNGVQTSWFHLGKGAVHGCIACGYCNTHDACVFDDDGANRLGALMRQADGVVLGSPVYYAAPNGAFCALLDRAFYAAGDVFRGKPAAAVVACRRAGSTAALDRLYKYLTINSMPLITSDYWSMVHGTNPEEVRQDKEGMQVMRMLGANMAWAVKGLGAAGAAPVLQEEKARTNFIR